MSEKDRGVSQRIIDTSVGIASFRLRFVEAVRHFIPTIWGSREYMQEDLKKRRQNASQRATYIVAHGFDNDPIGDSLLRDAVQKAKKGELSRQWPLSNH